MHVHLFLQLAKETDPKLEAYVEHRYKASLVAAGKAEALASVDVSAALDLYVEKGDWDQCIVMAEKQGFKV